MADKLLLVSVFVVLGFMGELPLWLVIAAVSRDALIVSGGASVDGHGQAGRDEAADGVEGEHGRRRSCWRPLVLAELALGADLGSDAWR